MYSPLEANGVQNGDIPQHLFSAYLENECVLLPPWKLEMGRSRESERSEVLMCTNAMYLPFIL